MNDTNNNCIQECENEPAVSQDPRKGYYYPSKDDMRKCAKGLGCNYGICDECIVTLNVPIESI